MPEFPNKEYELLLAENRLLHEHIHEYQGWLKKYENMLSGLDKCTEPELFYENLEIKSRIDRQTQIIAALWQHIHLLAEGMPRRPNDLKNRLADLLWFLQPARLTHYRHLKNNNFSKIIAFYRRHGKTGTRNLLAPMPLHASLLAKVWSEISRTLAKKQPEEAQNLAIMAWLTQPKAYRLKFLAFRLHENGQSSLALDLLEGLPPEQSFSESEQRYLQRIRNAVRKTAEVRATGQL